MKINKILIVEDQEATLESLENAVDIVMPRFDADYKPSHKEIAKCYSYEMKKITNSSYDLILLDHRMPIQEVGNLERTNFDLFSAQLVNIGYSLIPIIQQKLPKAIIIGTSSLSRNELREFISPRYSMSKMWGKAKIDLEKVLKSL